MLTKEPHKKSSLASCSSECLGHDESCPLCGGENQCRVAKGRLYKDVCWCQEIIVPSQILSRLADEWVEPACLCRPCLETIARVSREFDSSENILAEVKRVLQRPGAEINAADYYFDPDGKMVFTAAYHQKRGSCCQNQCRHCPY